MARGMIILKDQVDAVVDAAGGGNYRTLSAAVAAGKTRILMVPNASPYTESSPITTLPANCRIIGAAPGVVVDFSTGGYMSLPAGGQIRNIEFKSSRDVSGTTTNAMIVIGGDDVSLVECVFTWTHAGALSNTMRVITDAGSTRKRMLVTDCKVNFSQNDAAQRGIYIGAGSSAGAKIDGLVVTGGGASTQHVVWMNGVRSQVFNLRCETNLTNSNALVINNGNVSNVENANISLGPGSGAYANASNCNVSNINATGLGNVFIDNCKSTNMDLDSSNAKANNCYISGTLTLNANTPAINVQIDNCQVGTVSQGAGTTGARFANCVLPAVTIAAAQTSIVGSSTGALTISAADAAISGCRIAGNVAINSSGSAMSGNSISGTVTWGASGGGSAFSGNTVGTTGSATNASTTNAAIVGNRFVGGITDNGTGNTVANNAVA